MNKRLLKYRVFLLKSILLFISILLVFIGVEAQVQTKKYDSSKVYQDGKTYAYYYTCDGMLDNKYVSYYYNGKKKAEGEFIDNNRVGKWSVWDSTGKLCAKRFYYNNYYYKTIVPDIPRGPAKLLSAPLYKPTRNADSCYKWFYIEEWEIAWSKRTWSWFYYKDNPILGGNNKLFNLLYKQTVSNNIVTYKFTNQDFDRSFSTTIDIVNNPIDTLLFSVIGFMTKEDWFYDVNYGLADCRILGLCPIAVRKHTNENDSVKWTKLMADKSISISGDTVCLFWMYYPQVRKYLAKEKVVYPNIPYFINNLEDVFFWRYYNTKIVSAGLFSPVRDNWQIKLKMIDREHDIWLGKDVTSDY
ncbi:MAG TPA: hypothetical protein VN922_21485 [Bacteroidia bacterium]|nr:hypothetical protein [Bacteroidia bacterium]